MKTNNRYWITVVSKDHIERGVAGGFMQANHGKAGPLKRMQQHDWVIFYSPKRFYNGNVPCKAFTAIGRVADNEVYQHKMAPDFIPYRRNIQFYQCKDTPILPLVEQLSFIPNKTSWGYPFRFGFFEIQQADFELIKAEMLEDKLKEIKQ
jgi:hypothetical protein